MKKTFLIITLMVITVIGFANTNAVILPFQVQDGISTNIVAKLTELFTEEISRSPSWTLMQNADLDNIIRQFNLNDTTELNETLISELAKQLGQNTVVFFGNVYANKRGLIAYGLRIRCIDIKAGKIAFDKKCSATDEGDLGMVCCKAAIQIVANNKSQVVKTDLSEKERKFKQKYIDSIWKINPRNTAEMFYQYKKYRNIGVGMCVPGSVFAGVGFLSLISCCCIPAAIIIGVPVSAGVMVIGMIIAISSSYPISLSSKTNDVYRKITGESLRADLIIPSGDEKTLEIAMAIKL